MVRTPSTMLDLGTECPPFELTDVVTGKKVTREDYRDGQGLLVMFICNHCPYVQHIRPKVAELTTDFLNRGLGVVGVMANDVDEYPDDDPDHMRGEVEEFGYRFPYLFDEDQEVAKAFHAACTPDFFLFGPDLKLVYRGQFDDSRPKSDVPVTGADLKRAVDGILGGGAVPTDQKPSLGCNIKWKPGNAPRYFQG